MENNSVSITPIYKGETLLHKGKFISFYEKHFEIPKNDKQTQLISYEVSDYNARHCDENEENNGFAPKNKFNAYAVLIFPIIKYTNKKPKIIIIANFRFPLNKFCLEIPGGIIDKSDINNKNFHDVIKIAALRELEEETGYKGKFISYTAGSPFVEKNISEDEKLKLSANIFYDPWKSSDCDIQCIVEIDGDEINEKTKDRKQHLDDAEIIQVFEIEIDNLMEFIHMKMSKENYGCSNQLYNFALGLNFNKLIED